MGIDSRDIMDNEIEDIINVTSQNLKNLDSEILSNITEVDSVKYEKIEKRIKDISNLFWIEDNLAKEYLNLINKFWDFSDSILNENIKKQLWFDVVEWDVYYWFWYILFYLKKFIPNKFKELLPIMNIFHHIDQEEFDFDETNLMYMKWIISSIKRYWDLAYEYLKFCSPFEWSYMKEWLSHMQGKNFWETLEQMKHREEEENKWKKFYQQYTTEERINMLQDMLWYSSTLVQYIENFANQPESPNLYCFLRDNPQKLKNLWWKLVNTIDLNVDSWINFAFRWIMEMVKSRPDIEFPHLKEWANDKEKNERKQERENIIKEYERMLRNYISKDALSEQWKTFDKIFFTMSHEPNDETIMPNNTWVEQFWHEVLDYSVDGGDLTDEKNKDMSTKMLSDIEKYTQEHPNENILVCVSHHWQPSWTSGNWWSKEDWHKLANISPNIKIWSIRCYFWAAYDNNNIYNHLSSVSWFSNNTPTWVNVTEIITEASKKNLWFHEMEIYTRLNYPVSVTPLTESMEYINWDTGENEIWKIWLAQNDSNWNWEEASQNFYS